MDQREEPIKYKMFKTKQSTEGGKGGGEYIDRVDIGSALIM